MRKQQQLSAVHTIGPCPAPVSTGREGAAGARGAPGGWRTAEAGAQAETGAQAAAGAQTAAGWTAAAGAQAAGGRRTAAADGGAHAAPAGGTGRRARTADDAAARAAFPDWRFAPNIGGHPGVYEIENRALDPGGHLLAAMRRLAPWEGRRLVDLGCGTGFWLPGYAKEAARVTGVEPDPVLRARAADRIRDLPHAEVLPGSAERLPLPDRSVDVVHARFAYFWPPGCAAGLAEVRRVLKPGGALVVVDNDHRAGEFAGLLRAAAEAGQGYGDNADVTDAWWAERGASRTEVMSRWQFRSREDFEAVLGMEFPGGVADRWLAEHPGVTGLSYGYVLFTIR